MKELRLEELLRYSFSGGVGLLTLAIVFSGPFQPKAGNFADAAVILGLALIVGSLTRAAPFSRVSNYSPYFARSDESFFSSIPLGVGILLALSADKPRIGSGLLAMASPASAAFLTASFSGMGSAGSFPVLQCVGGFCRAVPRNSSPRGNGWATGSGVMSHVYRICVLARRRSSFAQPSPPLRLEKASAGGTS